MQTPLNTQQLGQPYGTHPAIPIEGGASFVVPYSSSLLQQQFALQPVQSISSNSKFDISTLNLPLSRPQPPVEVEYETKRRRLKVSRACIRCKNAKTCCDEERPCRRCLRLGVPEGCHDVEQRKPGRKRRVTTTPADPQAQSSLSAITQPVNINGQAASSCMAKLNSDFVSSQYIPGDSGKLALHTPTTKMAAVAGPLNPPKDDSVMASLQRPLYMDNVPLFGDMISDPSVLELFTQQELPRDTRPLDTAPNSLLQGAYYTVYDNLRSMRQQMETGLCPMREDMFQFICLLFFDRSMAYGIASEVAEQHRTELRVRDAPLAYGKAPVGILAMKFTDSCIQAMYANQTAAELFGLSVDEMERLIADPRENYFLRLWHYDDWKRMIQQHFTALIQTAEKSTVRGRFYHSSGTRFEAVWSTQVTYNDMGVPASKIIYVTRCDV